MYNNRSVGTQNLFDEPLTPPRQKKHGGSGGDEHNGFSPGLLDLHSFDTELISEVGLFDIVDRQV